MFWITTHFSWQKHLPSPQLHFPIDCITFSLTELNILAKGTNTSPTAKCWEIVIRLHEFKFACAYQALKNIGQTVIGGDDQQFTWSYLCDNLKGVSSNYWDSTMLCDLCSHTQGCDIKTCGWGLRKPIKLSPQCAADAVVLLKSCLPCLFLCESQSRAPNHSPSP